MRAPSSDGAAWRLSGPSDQSGCHGLACARGRVPRGRGRRRPARFRRMTGEHLRRLGRAIGDASPALATRPADATPATGAPGVAADGGWTGSVRPPPAERPRRDGARRRGGGSGARVRLASAEVIVTAPPAPGWGGRYWILVKVATDGRRGRLGRMLRRGRGARRHDGRDRRRVRAPHGRRGPGQRGADVPPSLFLRLHPAARPDRDGRVLGARDRLLGHPRQGAWPPGSGR